MALLNNADAIYLGDRPVDRVYLGNRRVWPTWLPSDLFANGEQGVAYDFTGLSALFQDSGRTIPVTSSGDPIGSVTDLSGHSNHAVQTISGARPAWSDDSALFGSGKSLVSGIIGLSSTTEVTVIVSLRKASTANQFVCELSANSTTQDGTFRVTSALSTLTFGARNENTFYPATSAEDYPPPADALLTGIADFSDNTVQLRINQQEAGSNTTRGSGSFADEPLYIGARSGSSFFLSGHIYRLLVIGRKLAGEELLAAEAWAAGPWGGVTPLSMLTEEGLPITTEEGESIEVEH